MGSLLIVFLMPAVIDWESIYNSLIVNLIKLIKFRCTVVKTILLLIWISCSFQLNREAILMNNAKDILILLDAL